MESPSVHLDDSAGVAAALPKLHRFRVATPDEIDTGESDGTVLRPTLLDTAPLSEVRVGDFAFQAAPRGAPKGLLAGSWHNPFLRRALPVAGKAVTKEELSDFLANEGCALHILHNFPHPGFSKLRTVAEPDEADTTGMAFLVMDAVGVDLGSYIQSRGPLPEETARILFRQLVLAVAHAHKHGVMLRQIRLEKIHFTDDTHTQLVFADLQGAVVVGPRVPRSRAARGRGAAAAAGSALHLDDKYGCAAASVDLYALGVVLHVMLTGDYPFNDADGSAEAGLAVSAPLRLPPHLTAAGRALINRMFDTELSSRPVVQDMLTDPWMQQRHSAPRRGPSHDRGHGRSHTAGAGHRAHRGGGDGHGDAAHVLPIRSLPSATAPLLRGRRRSIVLEVSSAAEPPTNSVFAEPTALFPSSRGTVCIVSAACCRA